MIRYSPLNELPEFCVGRFDHPADDHHHDPKLEATSEYSVSQVERGHFSLEIGGRLWELGPGDLFLNYDGMEYRCRHRELAPKDVCVSINFLPSAYSDGAIAVFENAARKRPVLPASNRVAYLFLQLTTSSGERMRVEEAAHGVMAAISQAIPDGKPYRQQQLKWYTERVDAVRQQIDSDFAAEQKLSGLARSVGMSPFHFARIFCELVGMPPHAYLRRARLQAAAYRLREGDSVTEACFASGFQNLSHFSRQFYREFGIKASSYARQGRQPAGVKAL
jgi:AraC family transcriptional regulator